MCRTPNESEQSAPPASEDAGTNLPTTLATLETGTQAGSRYTQLADASPCTSTIKVPMQPNRMRVDATKDNPDMFQY